MAFETEYSVTQQSLRLSGDGRGRVAVGHEGSNRVEVAVQWPATVSAGDVELFMIASDPESGVTLNAFAVTIVYNPNGGRVVLEIPPNLRQVQAQVTGYTGAGEIVAIATFWRQA